ncbi:MAG: M20/M25/M40 family metallo-hydrolase, partial [Candidatus Riflebacteria bacterium]|nr:M20/M25/M40 family metallo-hydrolase [Candidatus Riflebacteria bacterium]
MKQRLNEHFEGNRESVKKHIADLTCRLVRERTVNVPLAELHEHPYMDLPGQEERVVGVVAAECVKLKLDHKIFEKEPRRPNVAVCVGKGRKKLVVACHTDVTPPGKGWKTDPFVPVVKGGYIVGRGALGNKGPLAAATVAALALKPLEKQLKGQLIVLGFADYAAPHALGRASCGMSYLLKDGLVKPDFAIVPNVGRDLRTIAVAEKGRILLVVKAQGKQAHGALPDRGDNAVMRMARLLHRISTMTLPYKRHELLGRPTLNVGEIRGGVSPSIVPAECVVHIDIRYLP